MNEHLRKLFDELENSGIKYMLLTDFEGAMEGSDIDLFVEEKRKEQFEEILWNSGWFKRKEPARHLNHFFYYFPFLDVYIDVKYNLSFADGEHTCFTYNGVDKALDRAIKNCKGIYRPFGIDAVILYAAHLAFKERGRLQEKHKYYLTTYIQLYRSELNEQQLENIRSIEAWLQGHFPNNTKELKKIILASFTGEHKKMMRDKQYLKYGYGLKVLFLGTDGAGKTTLMNAVKKKLNLKTRELYLGMGNNGWTCRLTKNAYQLRFNTKFFNKLFNFLKTFLILPIEFFFRIIPVKIKSKYSIVLIDRFPGSVFLNKRSSNLLYNMILPKPDLVFFLYADPEVLLQRKPEEVTLEKSKKDIKRFEKVADVISKGRYISIDTSKMTIPEARDFIISEIYKSNKVYEHLLTLKAN